MTNGSLARCAVLAVLLPVCSGVTPAGRASTQDRPVFQDLWLHDTTSGRLTRLTTAPEPARLSSGASVSADGTRIVFHSNAELPSGKAPGTSRDIWLYDVTARRLTRITRASDPQRSSINPSISADGAAVVFESDSDLLGEGLPRGQREIWHHDVASGRTTRLTRAAGAGVSGNAVIDADGTTVVFQSNAAFDAGGTPGRSADIWMADTATGALTRVTRAGEGRSTRRPAIDANATRVAFESNADLLGQGAPANQVEIWLYDVPARQFTKVTSTSDPSRANEAPHLSADGRLLVFHSDADLLKEGRPDSVDEIWLYDVTAAKLRRLTSTWVPDRDAGKNVVLHPDCQYPKLTADGRKVVFASDADFLGEGLANGYPHAWILDLTTNALSRVDTSAGTGSGPAIDASAARIVLFRTDFDNIRNARVGAPVPLAGPAPPGSVRPSRLTAEMIDRDLTAFQQEIESRWSYLKANGADYQAAIARLRATGAKGMSLDEYGIELQKIISLFIDGHARALGFSYPRGVPPFFVEPTDGRHVAIKPDRTALVDPAFPYITRLDGRPIAAWIEAARPFAPQGSPQYREARALNQIRLVQFQRAVMGLPAAATVRVELMSEDRSRTREIELPVSDSGGSPGQWPRTESRLLDGAIGYLRIPSMNSAAVTEIQTWMPQFRQTRGLIVDVRGNGGGSRDALRALFPYVMRADAPPHVANAAKYRLHPDYDEDHLGGSRYMFRASWSGWSAAEREAIAAFARTFTPEWEPPPAEFSDWHYLVMTRALNPDAYVYGRPVVILMDQKCFSATDIFLSAFKGYPGVTLVGAPSGGGSARQVAVRLPESGLAMSLASMASFQRDGRLYDTHGVAPDIVVHPSPSSFLIGGPDVILERALATIK